MQDNSKYDETVIHESDGIQELDNKLPRWWVLLFYFSIGFALLYMMWFHLLDAGPGQEDKYALDVERAAAELAAFEAANAAPIDYARASLDEKVLASGSEIYTTHCITCHKADGSGLIGPNLTDDAWIHGPTFENSMHIISEGVLAKGMEAWKRKLSKRQMHAVASYIYTMRGATVPQEKAPEGEVTPGSDSPTYLMEEKAEEGEEGEEVGRINRPQTKTSFTS